MANTIEIKLFHVSERLPAVRVPVLVFTESGSKYIAARYETNPAANDPSKNQIKWGLLYNGKVIGEVLAVTHWCMPDARPNFKSRRPLSAVQQSAALAG